MWRIDLPNAEAFKKWKNQRIIPKEVRANMKHIDENFQKIVKFYCDEDSPIPGIVNVSNISNLKEQRENLVL